MMLTSFVSIQIFHIFGPCCYMQEGPMVYVVMFTNFVDESMTAGISRVLGVLQTWTQFDKKELYCRVLLVSSFYGSHFNLSR